MQMHRFPILENKEIVIAEQVGVGFVEEEDWKIWRGRRRGKEEKNEGKGKTEEGERRESHGEKRRREKEEWKKMEENG